MTTLETRAVHAGRRDLAGLGVHVPPIDLSTTNPLADVESGGDAYEVLATGGRPTPGSSLVYGRLWNPTWPASRTPWPSWRAARKQSPSPPGWLL